ncbi:MAG: hypothetical protein HOG49_30575, partial [Candidatus Scalindua sp.]|nr:hypothetical protein [Candidatus Scalindua sp.]
MSEQQVNVSGGMGLGSVLFIVFLVLKLCDVITWSWWWVTAPLWIPFAIMIAIFVVVLVFGGLFVFMKAL